MTIIRNATKLTDQKGSDITVQNPVPCVGAGVYTKDVWVAESVTTGWTDADNSGEELANIPFSNLHTHLENSTSDNPKTLLIHFNRTIAANQVGLGCYDTGDFSNVKISLLGSSGEVRTVVDESADNTKYNSRNYLFEPDLFNALQLEFSTTDTVCVSNITIQKAVQTNSFIQIQKPDDTVVNAQGTTQGNFKVSLEEYDATFDTNPLPVRNFTQVGVNGNVWDNELTGVDTVSAIVDTENYPHISIMGTASAATTFSVYVGIDGTNFYLCEDLSAKVNAATGLEFHTYFTAGARYFYLTSNTDVTATVSISAKP